jgi:hypothetical protein
MNEHLIRSAGLTTQGDMQFRLRPSLVFEFPSALSEMTAGTYDLWVRAQLP